MEKVMTKWCGVALIAIGMLGTYAQVAESAWVAAFGIFVVAFGMAKGD
jgi:hypothetical protein